MYKINKRGKWFYYIANTNPINWNGGDLQKQETWTLRLLKKQEYQNLTFIVVFTWRSSLLIEILEWLRILHQV